ncbi:MAG: hypothetical protein AAFR26_02025 [Cyanobacteria bacterium J06626_4]
MALFVIALLPLGFAGLVAVIVYDAENSYRDYDRVKACLQKHQFKVGEGWQHRDMYLEDFGWQVQLANEQWIELNIYDGSPIRTCRSRLQGLRVTTSGAFADDAYLPFDHPSLTEVTGDNPLATVEDVLVDLEDLLSWAAANPDALLSREAVSQPSRYLRIKTVNVK